MRKTVLIIIGIIIITTGVYLNRAYAYIYNTIGEKNLPFPQERHYFVGNSTDESLKIVFLGDSLTAGVGVQSLTDTYPYQLANKIASEQRKYVEVLNLAVPGAVSVDVRDKQIPQIGDFKPDRALVFIGINDMHNRVGTYLLQNRIEQIHSKLKNDYQINKIQIVDIPYLVNRKLFYPPYQFYFENKIRQYNQYGIYDLTVNAEFSIIKISDSTFKEFVKDKQDYYSQDLFHPNTLGYKLIANIIYDNLNF